MYNNNSVYNLETERTNLSDEAKEFTDQAIYKRLIAGVWSACFALSFTGLISLPENPDTKSVALAITGCMVAGVCAVNNNEKASIASRTASDLLAQNVIQQSM